MNPNLIRKYLDILNESDNIQRNQELTIPDPETWNQMRDITIYAPSTGEPVNFKGSNRDLYNYAGDDENINMIKNAAFRGYTGGPPPPTSSNVAPSSGSTSSNVAPSSGSTSSNVAPSSGSTSSNVAKSGGSRTSSKVDNTANMPSEPYAAPVDFNARSATRDIADTGLGKLSGGVSLGGGAGNYLSPQLRAELANQSGGKFYGDVGQSGSQFGYEQKFGDKARGQLAVRQTPGGGQSVGIGGSYDVTPNLKLTGGVSRDIKGQGGDRADIGLRYDFKESFDKRMNLLAKSLIEEI